MGKVSIVTADEARSRSVLRSGSESATAYAQAKYKVDKLPYFPANGDGTLQLFEIEMGPDSDVDAHAHTEDEIIYILKGSIHLGTRVLGPGDALYVAKDTLYGFKIGPEGCSFLNFRPTDQVKLLTKDEFMARRRER